MLTQVPFISNSEIEHRMQHEVEKSDLWPKGHSGYLDIEAFVGKYLQGILDKDATLPSDLMGEVKFRMGKRPIIKINVDLTRDAETSDEIWATGRWRMAVAHEGTHIILHAPLALSDQNQQALMDVGGTYTHQCFKKNLDKMGVGSLAGDAERKSRINWHSGKLVNESATTARMEIQANRAAAALLMPRNIFVPAACELIETAGRQYPNSSSETKTGWVVSELCTKFGVSGQAAHIRLRQLNLTQNFEQPPLF